MIEKQLYYLMMVAGYLAVFIMGSIIIVGVMSIGGCAFKSLAPQTLPDRGLEVPPNTLCCIPDENAPLTSCGGWKLCEFDSQGELI
jgi:hypothetical protein